MAYCELSISSTLSANSTYFDFLEIAEFYQTVGSKIQPCSIHNCEPTMYSPTSTESEFGCKGRLPAMDEDPVLVKANWWTIIEGAASRLTCIN